LLIIKRETPELRVSGEGNKLTRGPGKKAGLEKCQPNVRNPGSAGISDRGGMKTALHLI